MINKDLIDECFPFDEFRPGQRACIESICDAFNDGKKFVILEAPTGSGKSVIGMTLANMVKNSYYLTIQKILQDQLIKDFESEATKALKGRNAYPCDYWPRWEKKHADNPGMLGLMEKARKDPTLGRTLLPTVNCATGYCLTADGKGKTAFCFPKGFEKEKLKDSLCPYWQAVSGAKESKTCIMNFHSFLYQTQVSERFGPRELLIIDEAHNAEPQLMDFVALKLSDKRFRKQGITFPKLHTAEAYADFFRENELQDRIADVVRVANYTKDFKSSEEWKKVLLQYNIFMGSVSSGEWIPKWEDGRGYSTITLKPIYVDKHAHRYLFGHGEQTLMMSATILKAKVIYDSLGIDPKNAYAYRMKNRFPLKNRPIYFQPSGSMSYKNKDTTLPKLLKDIEKIASEYPGKKGIIHTHNFSICNYILENGSQELKERILFQKEFNNKDEMLKTHADSDDTIIMAPAMHEGLDLKGDLGRFQIICKVPYPSFQENEQLRIRMDVNKDYYPWLTALKLVQSYGRCIRSETDWADTFVLDADFEDFQRRSHKLLPKWFREAVV
tara:strand:- start:98766 stop:100430 length:1665 start_codon:yes stop_codon:yes gene_type:complete